MKNTGMTFTAIILSVVCIQPALSHADDSDRSSKAKDMQLESHLREHYKLTDEEMKKLESSDLNHEQKLRTVHLSRTADRPVEEVLKMRTEDKMGWGQIAQELNVHPGELGKGNKEFNRKFQASEKASSEDRAKSRRSSRDRRDKFREIRREKMDRMRHRKSAKDRAKGRNKN